MDLNQFLDNHAHLHTESRVSLEEFFRIAREAALEQTVSQEGLLTTVQDFIRGSKKGAEGRMAKDTDPKKFSKMQQLVRESYANPAWMNKQVFKMGEIDSRGITGELAWDGKIDGLDPVKFLDTSNAFLATQMANWKKSIEAYHRHFGPVFKKIHSKGEYSTEDYELMMDAIKGAGSIGKFAVNPPKGYEPSGVKFQYRDEGGIYVPKGKESKDKLPALSKDVAEKVGQGILKNLNTDGAGWQAARTAAEKLWDDAIPDKLIKHIKDGDRRWIKVSQWFDDKDVMLSFKHYTFISVLNDYAMFALCRWVDKSIR